MLSWLDRYWDHVRGYVPNEVANAVHWAEHALAGLVLNIFGLVSGAWNSFWNSAAVLYRGINDLGAAVYHFGAYILRTVIPSVIRWAAAQLARLSAALAALGRYVDHWIGVILAAIARAYRDIERWAIANIYAPLRAYADRIWNDLLKWGYTAFWWITHPADLAELLIFPLAASLEKHAWDLAAGLGKFTLALVVRNTRRLALLAEEIIAAVL